MFLNLRLPLLSPQLVWYACFFKHNFTSWIYRFQYQAAANTFFFFKRHASMFLHNPKYILWSFRSWKNRSLSYLPVILTVPIRRLISTILLWVTICSNCFIWNGFRLVILHLTVCYMWLLLYATNITILIRK